MKKILCLCAVLFFGMSAMADDYIFETNVNMSNFWNKNGVAEEKILTVASHILDANNIKKRVNIRLSRTPSVVNAFSYGYGKTVVISSGILPYLDSDDELAYLVGHEITHSLDSYGGLGKWIAMSANSKTYEYKADLMGIDLMANAGYNPVAAITAANKIFDEPQYDWGFSHPKGSKRLMKMYGYIYKKYPWALQSEMTHNVNYRTFTSAMDKEIKSFEQREKAREIKKKEML